MNVSLKQLLYVVTAERLRSISKASEQLNISQSSIGTAINLVEQEFGIQIFIRQPSKGLMLTPSGRQFVQRISALLTEVDSFEFASKGLLENLCGDLYVGCFAPMSPLALPLILRNLIEKHPDVSIHLHEGDLPEVQRFLLEGIVDVVFTYDLGLSDQISTEVLGIAPPHVVLPFDDPLSHKTAVSLTDLVDRPMILLDLPESRTYFEMMFASLPQRPRIAHRTKTYESVRSLVAAGLGFAILTLRPVIDETYTGEKVVCKPLVENIRAPRFVVGRRKQDYPSQLCDAFSDCCREYFQSPQAARHILNKTSG